VGPGYAETVAATYVNSRAASIFGGSREVQKNIIAKVVLGL
jgi:acyl-CoA dehydrogenase